jgi:chromosome segregation ATPase
MRSAALASKDEYDEVPVSSIEVLEANVVAIRADLNELKTDFRGAITRLDSDVKTFGAKLDSDIKGAVTKLESEIKAAVSKLENEIRDMAARAASDLEKHAVRAESQFAELRQDMREMRAEYKSLHEKVDKNHDVTTERLNQLDRKITDVGSRLSALIWVIGGLGSLITIAVTVGKALHWF